MSETDIIKESNSYKDDLYDYISSHFIGPLDGDTEILENFQTPHNRYLTGVLYAQEGATADDRSAEGGVDEADQESSDELVDEVAADKIKLPSSAGIGFRLSLEVTSVKVEVNFGTYKKTPSPSGQGNCYIRTPHDWVGEINLERDGDTNILPGWVRLSWVVRREANYQVVFITIENRGGASVLPEELRKTESLLKNCASIWQVNLKIIQNSKNIIPISPDPRLTQDEEINSHFLLYRNKLAKGFGFNCSAGWSDNDGMTEIWTDFIPKYDLKLMEPASFEKISFSVENFTTKKSLSENGLNALQQLVKEYEAWIASLDSNRKSLGDSRLEEASKSNIQLCKNALHRMKQGIKTLESNEDAIKAFNFANQAMLSQYRVGRKNDSSFSWFPFQIAFFLVNVEGLTNPDSPEREIVDLLWFPTGGGKTEAYLLISSYVLFLKRIKAKDGKLSADGVGVILRYTLRLLTQQQLQRATKLITAMDEIRQQNQSILGDTKFSIGLWVGGDSFPNENKKWEKLRAEGKAPIPITSCPLCNEKLSRSNYKVIQNNAKKSQRKYSKLEINCNNGSCKYSARPLPIHLSDEDVYQFCPSMIVGTVDKFAQVTWKEETGKLFNRFNQSCPTHGYFLPSESSCGCDEVRTITAYSPELIIQDELHLITGPLGSMVGAFEIAIRALCRDRGVEPKYIASTATIRGASSQLLNLYNRNSAQFPPMGTDIENSFFAKEASADNKQKIRTYIGVSAQGRSGQLVISRIYGLLNHLYKHCMKTKDYSADTLDYFRTIVGYFNARKELGKASTLLGDDVINWRKYYHDLDGSPYNAADSIRKEELMGGISSEKVMQTLDRMETKGHKAPEFVLATNILSVGIDVDRLAAMVIAGQPKTTSEYIQASSRVGRKVPGVVIANLNWARARDRSHYEKFRSYHEQLYRFVEGISVTPASPEARRRTLGGVLVAMVRHLVPEFSGDEGAKAFDRNHSKVKELEGYALRSLESASDFPDIRREVESFLDSWHEYARESEVDFFYKATKMKRGVLMPYGQEGDRHIARFVTSLRNVDEEIPLKLWGGAQ